MLYLLRLCAICLVSILYFERMTSVLADDDVATPYQLTDIDPAGIRGTVILHGPGEIEDSFRREFAQAAGGPDARLFVIMIDAVRPADPTARRALTASSANREDLLASWKEIAAAELHVVPAQSPEQLADPDLLAPLDDATGVWFEGSELGTAVWANELLAEKLQGVLDRGGLIAGGPVGALVADKYTVDNAEETRELGGLGLLPQVAVTHQPAITIPGYVSLHVGSETVAFIHGRTLGVVGQNPITITPFYHVALEGDVLELRDRRVLPILEANDSADVVEDPNTQFLSQFGGPRGTMADCTALRRMATLGPRFQDSEIEPAACEVENGSLLIVGGGGFTREMIAKFIELAGGEQAKIVIVPSAEENPQLEGRGDVRQFLEASAASAVVLHTTDRTVADSDEFIAPLAEATGIWFGGGRQWRLLDAYTGTKTEIAMREVLARGGVIGGSSAGATIQGDYLVRGNPLGNLDMMSAGYEDGFCYLPGCAIDQHFTQRGRHPDMALFKRHLPRMLGIGIDETTALVVTGRRAEVMGQGSVFFYDGVDPDQAEQKTEVAAGQFYDLIDRQIID